MASQQFCTFLLDRYLFGVPVPQVQEVIRFHPMTSVPLAPPGVQGLINLRGQIPRPFRPLRVPVLLQHHAQVEVQPRSQRIDLKSRVAHLNGALPFARRIKRRKPFLADRPSLTKC